MKQSLRDRNGRGRAALHHLSRTQRDALLLPSAPVYLYCTSAKLMDLFIGFPHVSFTRLQLSLNVRFISLEKGQSNNKALCPKNKLILTGNFSAGLTPSFSQRQF